MFANQQAAHGPK